MSLKCEGTLSMSRYWTTLKVALKSSPAIVKTSRDDKSKTRTEKIWLFRRGDCYRLHEYDSVEKFQYSLFKGRIRRSHGTKL